MSLKGTEEPITLVKALTDYFGKHPTLSTIAEFKALSDSDKDELRTMLVAEGYNIATR